MVSTSLQNTSFDSCSREVQPMALMSCFSDPSLMWSDLISKIKKFHCFQKTENHLLIQRQPSMQLWASSFDSSLRFATLESLSLAILVACSSGQAPAPFLAGFHKSSCLARAVYLPAVLLGSLSAYVIPFLSVNPFLNLPLSKPSYITAKEQLISVPLSFAVLVCKSSLEKIIF